MKEILLSICIPTYNRADTLEQSLKHLVENSEIDDRVEIIVSDNCSTDNTKEVVSRFPRVKYYCNETNIKDYNFSKALSYGNGLYLKLLNDTTYFSEGAISKMLLMIEKEKDKTLPLYFCQNAFNYHNCSRFVDSFDMFLEVLSVNITWTNVFGIWRKQFMKIEDKDRMANLQFAQVDWSLRNFEINKKALVVFDDFLRFIPLLKKGGYNIIKVFIVNYMNILHSYLDKNLITINAFNLEKKRLYKENIEKWLPQLYLNINKQFYFDVEGVISLVYRTYKRESYFWFSIPVLFYNSVKILLLSYCRKFLL